MGNGVAEGSRPTEQQYNAFQNAYSAARFGDAADIFLAALTADPDGAFRHFASIGSGQLAEALFESGRVDEAVSRLDALIADHPNIHLICPNEPAIIDRLVAMREANIEHGLPSATLISMGKSASIAVANIFNSGYGLPSFAYSLVNIAVIESWARDYARGGACYVTHLQPDREAVERLKRAGIDKVIVHVRDPRQTLVSLVHHFDRYPDQLVKHRNRANGGLTVSERAMGVLPLYVNTINWALGWLDLEGEIDILFSTFEDFVSDRIAFVESYLDFYGGDRKYFNWQSAFGEHLGVDSHFRSGRTDEWREAFTREEAEYLSSLLPSRLKARFGWYDEAAPLAEHRRRIYEVSWLEPRDRFLCWLSDGNLRADAAALDTARRLGAQGKPVPLDIEEAAIRARLRELPDNGGLLMRLWGLIAARSGTVPDGLEIHALRSRLAELSKSEGLTDAAAVKERVGVANQLAVEEAKAGPRAHARATEAGGT